jgi:hypothetical protein
MIHRNINYGGTENVTVIEFGKGTLAIVNARNKEEKRKGLLIKQKPFSHIGEVAGHETNSFDFSPEIVLEFSNREGFNVFKEFVSKIDKEFEKESL